MQTIEMPETSEIAAFKSTCVEKAIDPRVDLGYLLLEDLEPIDFDQCELQSITRENAQYLFNQIWKLETKRVEDAICVQLPPVSTYLPREKPIPQPKPATKWQKYADLKGIRNVKNAKKIWDEHSQSWKPTFGYNRGNDQTKEWLIEIPDHKDPYKDYFEEKNSEKKERKQKNELQRLRNLAKNANFSPLGVGIDTDNKTTQDLAHQMNRAKMATSSLGKFQEKLAKEKPSKNSAIKRKFVSNEQNARQEQQHQLEILKKLDSKKSKIDTERVFASQTTENNADCCEKSTNRKRGKLLRQKSSIHRQKHFLQNNAKKQSKKKGQKVAGRSKPSGKRK